MYFNVSTLDLEARWRPLSDAESDIGTILLSDADVKVNNARPQLVAAIASADPLFHIDEQLVVIVVCDMVLRVMMNPDSFRTTTIGADGSIGVGYFGTEVLRPRIAIAPGDLDEIDRALRATNQASAVVRSRVMRNVDYGVPTLPLP